MPGMPVVHLQLTQWGQLHMRPESKSITSVRSAVLTVLAVAAAAPAYAQRTEATGIEEIIVTAQKREESLQSVPVAVTALDSTALERTFARDLMDVTNAAPNLIIDPVLGNGTAAISIRGLQLNDVEKSFDPAVSVYLDGVYLATTTGALLQIWDSEAVEVLRGPQGTLFGRNTIGGLVHVRRKKPTGEFDGRATVTVGEYDRLDANLRIDLPAVLNDTLSFKGTVMYQSGGGYFRNVTRKKDEGNNDFLGFTAMALWEPTDNFSAWLTYDHFDDKTPTRPVTSLTQPGEAFSFAGGRPPSDSDYHLHPTTSFKQDAFVRTDAITLNAEWQLNDANGLYAVVGWRDTKEDAFQEFDGVALDLFRTQRPQTSDQTSVELRWQGSYLDDRLKTVLGLYWMENSYELQQVTTSYAFFGPPGGENTVINTTQPQFRQDSSTQAVFGQIDWDITDNFMLTLGARASKEEKEACGTQRLELVGVGLVTVSSTGKPGFAYCNASDAYYQSTYVDPVTGLTKTQKGHDTWNSFTPKIGLTYKFDNGLAYLTYSEGFRSGGFNGRSTDAVTLGPYDPEKVKTIELGAKTQWMDNRLQVNAALFTTDYTDKQEDVVFPDPTAVTVTLVQNAASATINGLELELKAVPVDGLTLSASLGLLDAGYDKWVVPGVDGNPINKSKLDLRRAPKTTFGLGALYEHQVNENGFMVFNIGYNWRDDYWIIGNSTNSQPGRPGLNKAYGLLDASIGYDADRWRVSVYGKNLTDEHYFLHTLDVGAGYNAASATDSTPVYIPGLWTFGTINAPRTFGVELDFKF